jgi:hypothetical protein
MIEKADKNKIVIEAKWIDKREIPCRDMDIDCLPDESGCPPFGSYSRCFLYEPEKGSCPFLPIITL